MTDGEIEERTEKIAIEFTNWILAQKFIPSIYQGTDWFKSKTGSFYSSKELYNVFISNYEK